MSLKTQQIPLDEQPNTSTHIGDLISDKAVSLSSRCSNLNLPIGVIKNEADIKCIESEMQINEKCMNDVICTSTNVNVNETTLNSPNKTDLPIIEVKNETSTGYVEPVKSINNPAETDLPITRKTEYIKTTVN